MVNKKGFLRTIEAIIAIIMVLGFILYVTPTRIPDVGEVPGVVEQAQSIILDEVATNEIFRDCILTNEGRSCINMDWPCADLDDFITSAKPLGYNFNCEICKTSVSCVPALSVPDDKTVYTRDTFIAATPPKVFRVYMWEV